MDDELREMTCQKMNLDSMSRMLRVPKHRIVLRLAQMGLDIPGKVPIDTLRLFRLWKDSRHTVCTIARELSVPEYLVYRASSLYGMPKRRRIILGIAEEEAPGPEEEQASLDSLRLAPSVEREAARVRARWTESERYLRRVQRVQPLTYDRVGIGVA